jgi:hypothetical protein
MDDLERTEQTELHPATVAIPIHRHARRRGQVRKPLKWALPRAGCGAR